MKIIIRFYKEEAWKKTTLGVVVYYTGQPNALRILMQKAKEVGMIPEDTKQWLKVLSCAKFQGLESDWFVIATSRAHADDTYREPINTLGFLSFDEVANVSLTRARYGVVVVMQPSLLSGHEIWRFVYNAAMRQDNILPCAIESPQIESSMFRIRSNQPSNFPLDQFELPTLPDEHLIVPEAESKCN